MPKQILELNYLSALENIKSQTRHHRNKYEALLNYLCEHLVFTFDCPGVWIGIKTDDGRIKNMASAGELAKFINQEEIRWDDPLLTDGPAGLAIKTGRIQIQETTDNHAFLSWRPIISKLNIKALLSIPIIINTEIVGAITVCSKSVDNLQEESFSKLAGVAVQASTIMEMEKIRGILDKYHLLLEDTQKLTSKLSFLETHDILTEIPNRSVFTRKLNENISNANGKQFAVFLLDIDRFKFINDTFGHDVGDTLLRQVVERIKGLLADNDLICRIGGDEFAILINSRQYLTKIYEIASNIVGECYQKFIIKEKEVYITISMGVAVFPDNGESADSLLKHADMAMYSAKNNGGNRCRFYVSPEELQPFKSYYLLSNLNNALKNNEFELYYQPQQELATGRIIGVEALLRWFSPTGFISPTDFIPLAEDTGLIVPIGEWVLKTACEQSRKWQLEGYNNLKISVNISAKQFYQPNFVSMLDEILANTNLEPKMLNIEITESIAMKNFCSASNIISELSTMGVTITIDDFGTGYSSLNYLANLELDYLKIDKSLIENIDTQGKKSSVVKGIPSIAHNLGIKVVAEGVERQEELDFLKRNQCDLVQGYLIGRPMPIQQVVAFLDKTSER